MATCACPTRPGHGYWTGCERPRLSCSARRCRRSRWRAARARARASLPRCCPAPGGEVVLVPSDFPSVTYPWLAAQGRLGMRIRWVRDTPDHDLTLSLGDAIGERTTVVRVG